MEFNGNHRENESKQIVSTVAYLIGSRENSFSGNLFLRAEYDKLEKNQDANIIRHLCILRTALLKRGKEIDLDMLYNLRSLNKVSKDLIPQESIEKLRASGIEIVKANKRSVNYIMDINALIEDRIGKCKSLFPVWIEWKYIRNLFIMPKGNTDSGVNNAKSSYLANYDTFPYHCYINIPNHQDGNILWNDRKFVGFLYNINGDNFGDMKIMMDVSDDEKANLMDFLSSHEKICVVVDCENSNPYLLCDVLNNIKANNVGGSANHIQKVILFDDSHTIDAWRWLTGYLSFPVEHILCERINEHKSLVDQRITATTQQEYYENGVTGFLLVSSDSDYWGLIAYSKADFLVLAEREKTGACFTDALKSARVNYSFLEDFASANSSFKEGALMEMMNRYLSERVAIDINAMFEALFTGSKMPVTTKEENMMKEHLLRKLRLNINKNGELSIICA